MPLGVGGAFTSRFYHNNYIFDLNGITLLLDAGTTLRDSLGASDIEVCDIDYVFITHFHFDHVGGLEELLMKRYWRFVDNEHAPLKLNVIVHETQVNLYHMLLQPGLSNQGLTLNDYCEFIVLPESNSLHLNGYEISLTDISDLHVKGMKSFAVKILETNSKKNILFTSDIKFLTNSNFIEQINENTCAIFQDISFTENQAHSTLNEVLSYYPKRFHNKIYAMHYCDDIESYTYVIQQANINITIQGKPILIE
ncbi:MBL fold metallo-hydrolase [Metabacillus bambusae]|nr:MBL fold metallo-hydrolase [Metabacillus bambusae]